MTMGASAGKRRCKSAKASGLPTKNRSARPELQNAFGPTLQKGWGTRKSEKQIRRPRDADDGRHGMRMGGRVRKTRRVAANGVSRLGPQVRHFTMLTGFRLMTTSLF
jgi:hypothetical protein